VTFLIDTNVISELRRPRTSNKHLFAWRDSVEGKLSYISVMTVIELEFGALRAEHNRHPEAAILRSWLNDNVLVQYDGRILPIDTPVAFAYAKLQRKRTFPPNDALIAATALVHDLTVVTRNARDFRDSGVRIFDPWTYSP
jgi:predicted nucleic acid-binding protein